MKADSIPYSNTLLQEIKKSHLRSKLYGIDPDSTCNLEQVRLSPEALESLRQEHSDYYQVALSTMQDLHGFFPNAGFVMAVTDHNGFNVIW